MATGSVDGSARVFDAATGAELARLDHDGDVYAVAFSPDGIRVATGSGDGSARVFDAATGMRAGPARPRRRGICGGVQPGWHPGGHRQRRRFGAGVRRGHGGGAGPARSRWRGVGGGVQPGWHAVGHRQLRIRGSSARVFEAATGTELARLDHDGAVKAVVFSPDGTRVATGS